MDHIRFLLATCSFSLACYLIYDLVMNGFDFLVFIMVFVAFAAAHFLLPKSHYSDRNIMIEIVEFVINLPYRIMAKFLRSTDSNSILD